MDRPGQMRPGCICCVDTADLDKAPMPTGFRLSGIRDRARIISWIWCAMVLHHF